VALVDGCVENVSDLALSDDRKTRAALLTNFAAIKTSGSFEIRNTDGNRLAQLELDGVFSTPCSGSGSKGKNNRILFFDGFR